MTEPLAAAAAAAVTGATGASTPLVAPVLEDTSGVSSGPLAASKNAIEPSRDPRRRAR